MKLVLILALVVPLLASCGSTSTGSGETSAPENTTSGPEAPEPSGESGETAEHRPATSAPNGHEPAPSGVTGFGATEAAWSATHTEDHDFAPHAVYNPNPALPEVNGHTGAEYTSVEHSDGHITGYEYHTTDGSIGQVKAKVLSEQFPPDAHEVWFVAKGSTCAFMLVQSEALAHELGSHAIGDTDGTALVEFGSGEGESYNPESVNSALVQFGIYKTPGEAQC